MRGGRNKFGPMYKRDRARKLQIMRQRQLALQTLRAAEGGNLSQLSPTGYGQSYSHMNIKQEIQIPQVSVALYAYGGGHIDMFVLIFPLFVPSGIVVVAVSRRHRYHR